MILKATDLTKDELNRLNKNAITDEIKRLNYQIQHGYGSKQDLKDAELQIVEYKKMLEV